MKHVKVVYIHDAEKELPGRVAVNEKTPATSKERSHIDTRGLQLHNQLLGEFIDSRLKEFRMSRLSETFPNGATNRSRLTVSEGECEGSEGASSAR